MKTSNTSLLSFVFVILFSILFQSSAQETREKFIKCLLFSHNSTSFSQLIYTSNNSSYMPTLDSLIRNQQFQSPSTPKPEVIVTPLDESQIQATIYCAKKYGLQIRIRSGGHDFEGSSYVSEVPFVLIDMFNLRSTDIDVENATAWVQSGATLGEVYYRISQKSRTLAFPAGYWSTVGVGGHFSGGGYGPLLREYGLAADNVIDARLIDVNGRILTRSSMGEDLFWAIRGGGANNFGVIVAWKVNLVAVPENVTVFKITRTSEQHATKLVHRWQYVAHALPKNLHIGLNIKSVNSSQTGKRTILVTFFSMYLGGIDKMLQLMKEKFPELGLLKEDCTEMSWIQSVVKLAGPFPSGAPPDILLNKTIVPKQTTKQKADYVEEPISEDGLEGLWRVLHKIDAGAGEMIWNPYGGRMNEISESEIPYPHRNGNIYIIYEAVYWDRESIGPISPRHIRWIRKLYKYLTPYVSKNPRGAYANYRDYDLGVNNKGNTSYEQASVWGIHYFKNNFKRLAQVKKMVDPNNFFKHEQSIPPMLPSPSPVEM